MFICLFSATIYTYTLYLVKVVNWFIKLYDNWPGQLKCLHDARKHRRNDRTTERCLPFSANLFLMFVARLDVAVVDIGQPADWVKVNVQKTVSCGACLNLKYIEYVQ